MNTRMLARLVACALLMSAAFRLNAATNASWTTSTLLKQLRDEGNRPINPICIASNLYHVGAVNLAVFLLTSPEGQSSTRSKPRTSRSIVVSLHSTPRRLGHSAIRPRLLDVLQ